MLPRMPLLPDIAVLGTLTRDTTVYADGSRTENLGGLLYTLTTLAALFDGQARIRPVANVGADFAGAAYAALRLPGIDPRHVHTVPEPNNHVYLQYHDAIQRDEVLVGLVRPVGLEHACEALEVMHYMVNLTSGRDVERATLEELRRRYAGVIQLDVHSLTLGFGTGGLRVLAVPPDWPQWVACADWVQMNETEARLLGATGAVERFAVSLLDLGPSTVLVTLGGQGVVGAWREGRDRRSLRLGPPARYTQPFPTGCGDVFGAAFAFARLRGAGVADAMRVANGVAGTKAGLEPLSALHAIRTHAAAHLARWI